MPMANWRELVVTATCFAIVSLSIASSAEENPCAEAAFATISDALAVILFVQVSSPVCANESDSMGLFGEGCLEDTSSDALQPEQRRFERHLDAKAQRGPLRLAVLDGLIELNVAGSDSEKALAFNTRRLSIADGFVVILSSTLGTHQRGGQERAGVVKGLSVSVA